MPRLAIIDFQGSSAMIAKPLVAWMISDQRDGAVANANASQPVRNAAASTTRRPMLVQGACSNPSLDSLGAARVAQGIEQDAPNVKVGGSIPSAGTTVGHHCRVSRHRGRGRLLQDIVD